MAVSLHFSFSFQMFYLCHFLPVEFVYYPRSKIPFTIPSFFLFHFFLLGNWNFHLYISSVTFLFGLWTNEMVVTFCKYFNTITWLFIINITISFQKLIKILSLVPFFSVLFDEKLLLIFADNIKFNSIAFFTNSIGRHEWEENIYHDINISKLLLPLVMFDTVFSMNEIHNKFFRRFL